MFNKIFYILYFVRVLLRRLVVRVIEFFVYIGFKEDVKYFRK